MENFKKKIFAKINGVEKTIDISTNLYSPLPFGFSGTIYASQDDFELYKTGDVIEFDGFSSIIEKKERDFLTDGKIFVKC